MNFPTIKHSIKILKPKPLKTQKPLFLSNDKKRGSKIKTGGDLLSRSRSTIGARGLNFCVRNGNR